MATKYIQITVTQKLRSPANSQFSLTTNFSMYCSFFYFLHHMGIQISTQLKNISRVSSGYLPTLKFILFYLSPVALQSRSGNSCSTCDFQNVPQRVNFDIGSSVPPKVNSDAQSRWISKLATTANVEVLEELPRDEWSFLYVLANDALASYSP
jgi:hypothetical protein